TAAPPPSPYSSSMPGPPMRVSSPSPPQATVGIAHGCTLVPGGATAIVSPPPCPSTKTAFTEEKVAVPPGPDTVTSEGPTCASVTVSGPAVVVTTSRPFDRTRPTAAWPDGGTGLQKDVRSGNW